MLSAQYLVLSAAAVLGASQPYQLISEQRCELPKRTHISVIPRTLDVKYDYSKTLSEIQSISSSSDLPLPPGLIGITHGLMRGEMRLSPRVVIAHQEKGVFDRRVCAWFDKIEVRFEVDPTIIIPKEVFDDPCMRREVTAHEQEHVKVDRDIMQKYTKVIGDNIKAALDKSGYSSTPFEKENVQGVIKAMRNVVYKAMNKSYQAMSEERQRLQGQVDSVEEYQRLGRACKGFNPRAEMSKTKAREERRNYRRYEFGGNR